LLALVATAAPAVAQPRVSPAPLAPDPAPVASEPALVAVTTPVVDADTRIAPAPLDVAPVAPVIAVAPVAPVAIVAPPVTVAISKPDPAHNKKDAILALAPSARAATSRAAYHRVLDARVGQVAEPIINIYNQWTHEFLPIDATGAIDLEPAQTNRFFRCRFTNVATDMDPRLIQVVVDGARHFDATRVNVVSGFRSPKYNLMLQKKGRNVARRSQHTEGKAVDFRVQGISTRALHAWVRSLRLGGVGFYTHSQFVHADTGRVRYWTAR
jgi:uncharacterized protein YcbK (DUF882 family)